MSGDENSQGAAKTAAGLAGLEALLRAQGMQGLPPVERWNPPYCGDIGLEIQADGTWSYQGSPIGRMAMVKLFSRVLRRDEDGGHFLVTPAEKVDIKVWDAPFLAVEMEAQGHGSDQVLLFRTNVDDVVRCGPEHPLRFEIETATGGLKPYLLVRGRLEARVTRALTYDLVAISAADPASGQLGLWSGGRFFTMAGPE